VNVLEKIRKEINSMEQKDKDVMLVKKRSELILANSMSKEKFEIVQRTGSQMIVPMTARNLSTPSRRVELSPIKLPEHWEQKTNEDGKTYYIDHLTNTTTLQDPRRLGPDEVYQCKDANGALVEMTLNKRLH
jgi:hypothetical protein